MRRTSFQTLCALSLAWVVTSTPALAQEGAAAGADHPLARALLGAWDGEGVVYGNKVTLEREWTLVLADQFLRADMRVHMANGQSFRALSFWRPLDERRFEVVWMDEQGNRNTFEAVGDDALRTFTAHMINDNEEGTPEWRRVEYRILGPDTYQEVMYRDTPDGWEQVADFRFTRRDD